MNKIKADHGGFYQSYASGDGSISFVHNDHNGLATCETVPVEIATSLKPDGWILVDFYGYFKAFQPVTRKNENTLIMDNQEYQYLKNIGDRYTFLFKDDSSDEFIILKHISTIASLSFYLNNEVFINKVLNTPLNDEAITQAIEVL